MNIGFRVSGFGFQAHGVARLRVVSSALMTAAFVGGATGVVALCDEAPVIAAPAVAALVTPTTAASAPAASGAAASAASGARAINVTTPSPSTQRTVLGNGATLVIRLDRTAPRVAISLLVRAGAADETTATAGWRRLLAEAMLRASIDTGPTAARNATAQPAAAQPAMAQPATAQPALESAAQPVSQPADAPADAPVSPAPPARDAQPSANAALTGTQLQRRAEAVGGRIGAGVGDDVIEFWAVGDSSGAGTLLDLLLTVALRPRLSAADVEAARGRLVARVESEQNDIRALAASALRGQLYRDARGEPLAYGLPDQGTRQSLEALTRDKLSEYHRRYFQPSRLTVSAAGDVNAAVLRARLAKLAATATPAALAAAPRFAPVGKSDPLLIVRQGAPQPGQPRDAWVFISYLVAGFNHADGPALRVLAAVLGESPNQSGARLPRRLMTLGPNRLTFGASAPSGGAAQAAQTAALLTPRRFGGEIILFAQTEASDVNAVKNALLDETRKLREMDIGSAELTRAKNFVRGSWAVDREALRDRAFQAGLVAALNPAPALPPGATAMSLPADTDYPARVARVTAADVRRVAQKYLSSYAVALIVPETTSQ